MNIHFSLLLFEKKENLQTYGKKRRAAHNLEQFLFECCYLPFLFFSSCIRVCLCDVFESLVIGSIRICLGKETNGLSSSFFVLRRHLTLVVLSSLLLLLFLVVLHSCTYDCLSLSLFCLLLLSLLFSFLSSIVATKFLGIVATTVANSFVFFCFFLCVSSIGFRVLIRVVFLTCH